MIAFLDKLSFKKLRISKWKNDHWLVGNHRTADAIRVLSIWCHQAPSLMVDETGDCMNESSPLFSKVPISKQDCGCSTASHCWPSHWTLQALGLVFKFTTLQSLHQNLIYRPGFPAQESSPTPQFKSISFSALSFLYGSTLTSIHDYRKNHSLD